MKGKRKRQTMPMTQAIIWMPILTIGLAFITAKLILQGTIAESQGRGAVYLIVFIVSCACSLITRRRCVKATLLWCLGTALVYACILMMGNLLFFGVAYEGVGMVWLIILSGGFLAALLPKKKKGKFA